MENGAPLTGDYDMHDIISSSTGERIPGGSAKENRLIKKMNRSISCGDPAWPDRIKHGAQANYPDYLKDHPEATPKANQLKPDPPITAIDSKATPPDKPPTVYRLETDEDIVNMYRCKGTDMPPEWDVVQVKDKSADVWELEPVKAKVSRTEDQ